MSNQENISPPRENINSSSSTDNTIELMEMSDRLFRIFIVTKLNEMQKKTDNKLQKMQEKRANKLQLQEMRKSFHDFKEEIDTVKKNRTELLEMKTDTGNQNLP